MTELELRKKFVDTAKQWLGYKESDGSFKVIIDLYNTQKPLPVGYKMKYTDHWCACYVTAVGMKAGLSKIILPECGCERMINLYKKAQRWQENDAYVPQIGDIIMYDWQDNGVGDNMGYPDHVGIVAEVNGDKMKIIEGNMDMAVGYRNLPINARNIRGWCLPDFASMADGIASAPAAPSVIAPTVTVEKPSTNYKVGDIVTFAGNVHYSNAGAANGKSCRPGRAKVTAVAKNYKHPYHLIAISGMGSNVYGWVDENTIRVDVFAVNDKVKIIKNAIYGGLAPTRGRKVPSRYIGQPYTVMQLAIRNGIQEALIKELYSWVPSTYLIKA